MGVAFQILLPGLFIHALGSDEGCNPAKRLFRHLLDALDVSSKSHYRLLEQQLRLTADAGLMVRAVMYATTRTIAFRAKAKFCWQALVLWAECLSLKPFSVSLPKSRKQPQEAKT